MAENNRSPSETETIMMALDQVSQTIEVMTSVVSRLRNYIKQQEVRHQEEQQQELQERDAANAEKNTDFSTDVRADRILH